jgi:hypothetical protein
MNEQLEQYESEKQQIGSDLSADEYERELKIIINELEV